MVADIVAPVMPERLMADKLEKKLKKVVKEGGKRGVEIEGAADMGGLKYFCTKMLEPAGDLGMLVESVKAMNAKSDPSEEERKGGSGHIGKVVMSMADDNNLCVVAYSANTDEISAKEWLRTVLDNCGATAVEMREDSTDNYAQVCVVNDGEKGIFCLKMRDYVIQHANGVLRTKGLIPEDDEESEDEFVFGDDDFPSAEIVAPVTADIVAPVTADIPAPVMPERLMTEKLEKKMKKVVKEGGKRGVEIEGAADMGGLRYFCTKMLEPAGDLDMLVESVKAMNAKSDPSEEERKGGSGHIGKVVMSMADDNNLCVVAYSANTEEISAKEWLRTVLDNCGASVVEMREDSTDKYAQVCVVNDGEKGVFCLKMRDYVIQHANGVLRTKGLIPEDDDESEDEFVFGDDDFP